MAFSPKRVNEAIGKGGGGGNQNRIKVLQAVWRHYFNCCDEFENEFLNLELNFILFNGADSYKDKDFREMLRNIISGFFWQ